MMSSVVACVTAVLSWVLQLEYKVRHRLFAIIFGIYSARVLIPLTHDAKKDLFSTLSSCRKSKSSPLTILEIGAGGGETLQYYPSGAKVLCVEPNPGFNPRFESTRARMKHLDSVHLIRGVAEDMKTIEDASVDAVVSIYVLCSVTSTEGALKEIHRVLRPGGKFYYMEHVTFDPKLHPVLGRLQKWCTPFWLYISCGCHFRSPTHRLIRHHGDGFTMESYRSRMDLMRGPWKYIFWPVCPHEYGVTIKQR